MNKNIIAILALLLCTSIAYGSNIAGFELEGGYKILVNRTHIFGIFDGQRYDIIAGAINLITIQNITQTNDSMAVHVNDNYYRRSVINALNLAINNTIVGNETDRVNALVGNCTPGYVMFGVETNGTKICVIDNSGAGGSSQWIVSFRDFRNNSGTLELNWTFINLTSDVKITLANISQTTHTDARDIFYNDSITATLNNYFNSIQVNARLQSINQTIASEDIAFNNSMAVHVNDNFYTKIMVDILLAAINSSSVTIDQINILNLAQNQTFASHTNLNANITNVNNSQTAYTNTRDQFYNDSVTAALNNYITLATTNIYLLAINNTIAAETAARIANDTFYNESIAAHVNDNFYTREKIDADNLAQNNTFVSISTIQILNEAQNDTFISKNESNINITSTNESQTIYTDTRDIFYNDSITATFNNYFTKLDTHFLILDINETIQEINQSLINETNYRIGNDTFYNNSITAHINDNFYTKSKIDADNLAQNNTAVSRSSILNKAINDTINNETQHRINNDSSYNNSIATHSDARDNSIIQSILNNNTANNGLYVNITGDKMTGGLTLPSINITDFLSFQGNHTLQIGDELFDSINEEGFVLRHHEDHADGTMAFMVTTPTKTVLVTQSGKNNSAGIWGNSLMIMPNDMALDSFGANMSAATNCIEVYDLFNKTRRINCDTGSYGASAIIQGGLHIWRELFIDEGILSFGPATFNMQDDNFNILNGTIWTRQSDKVTLGFIIGQETELLDVNFEDGTLNPFEITLGIGVNVWTNVDQPQCHQGRCASAGSAVTTDMNVNITTNNFNATNITFYATEQNIDLSDLFEVAVNNFSGSGWVVVIDETDLIGASDSFLSSSLPAGMSNQTTLGIRFSLVVDHPTNEIVWVDDVVINAIALATVQQNVTRLNTNIRLGDGDNSIFWNGTTQSLILPGNVSFQSVTEQNLTIADTITLNGTPISDWFQIGPLIQIGISQITGLTQSHLEGLGLWSTNNFTQNNISRWDEAYAWGDHNNGINTTYVNVSSFLDVTGNVTGKSSASFSSFLQSQNGLVYLGNASSSSRISFFNDGGFNEWLMWNNTEEFFTLTDDLSVEQSIASGVLKQSSCDVKAFQENGSLYCGTDASGGGSGTGFWYVNGTDLLINLTLSGSVDDINISNVDASGTVCDGNGCIPATSVQWKTSDWSGIEPFASASDVTIDGDLYTDDVIPVLGRTVDVGSSESPYDDGWISKISSDNYWRFVSGSNSYFFEFATGNLTIRNTQDRSMFFNLSLELQNNANLCINSTCIHDFSQINLTGNGSGPVQDLSPFIKNNTAVDLLTITGNLTNKIDTVKMYIEGGAFIIE